ncbi:hypothetical protein O6P43_005895 [Quillaja saponaria]|uniref:Uncharacterized protein n=1 Tax=Quillaja saponaria TaxID=32244 RepID=A0AAD7Q755_QUISA|nr:hypothetical protein O6P43_005895 [Quillaja saponaria]
MGFCLLLWAAVLLVGFKILPFLLFDLSIHLSRSLSLISINYKFPLNSFHEKQTDIRYIYILTFILADIELDVYLLVSWELTRSVKINDTSAEKNEEFAKLWSEAETFVLDLGWLAPYYEQAMKIGELDEAKMKEVKELEVINRVIFASACYPFEANA